MEPQRITKQERSLYRSTFFKAMHFDPRACDELVETLWSNPDQLIESGQRLTKKQCVRTTVAFESSNDSFVVKRHVERSWRHTAKQWFCVSRAEKCWRDTMYLLQRGYPTPRPWAYLEERFGSLRGKSYYVYEYVPGTTLRQIAAPMKNQRLLRQYVRQLCEIWRLHWHLGVNLHDGHPDNFVVAPSGKIWVIDLDKLQYLHGIPQPLVKDQLVATFMKTLNGVFGDYRIINYGHRRIDAMLGTHAANSMAA